MTDLCTEQSLVICCGWCFCVIEIKSETRDNFEMVLLKGFSKRPTISVIVQKKNDDHGSFWPCESGEYIETVSSYKRVELCELQQNISHL